MSFIKNLLKGIFTQVQSINSISSVKTYKFYKMEKSKTTKKLTNSQKRGAQYKRLRSNHKRNKKNVSTQTDKYMFQPPNVKSEPILTIHPNNQAKTIKPQMNGLIMKGYAKRGKKVDARGYSSIREGVALKPIQKWIKIDEDIEILEEVREFEEGPESAELPKSDVEEED